MDRHGPTTGVQPPVMPPDPRTRWRLPRLTGSVFSDLALWMVGLGLAIGLVFPAIVMLLGVSAAQVLTLRFYAATVTAGLLVGGVNYLLARSVVGTRMRLLSHRTGFVGEMVSYAADSGDWTRCDHDGCLVPVDSDDEIGESARAFNRLIDALGRSHATEAAVRDLLETLSSHLELHALSQAALTRLLAHSGLSAGAVVVDNERELRATAVCGPLDVVGLLDAPEVLTALRTRTTQRLPAASPDSLPLTVTPIEFEQRGLGCVVFPEVDDGDTQMLTGLFVRAFGVALNNALNHARAERLAELDPLTGVANRRAGLRALERQAADAKGDDSGLAVLMIDLDHFKKVNDHHGHLVGDRVLVAAVRSVCEVVRKQDTVVRYGGEEFLVILPGADAAGAHRAADEVRRAIADGQSDVPITTSLGSAALGPDESVTALLERADRALYQAKAAGRNRAVAADPAVAAQPIG